MDARPAMSRGPVLAYPDRRLPDLVCDQARLRPHATAVRQGGQAFTYRELCATAAALAADLAPLRTGPAGLIGVCADRRPPLVAGLLATMMAGCGYVPLDLSLPPARLREIADEAGLRAVVCDPAGAEVFAGHDVVAIPPWRSAGTPPHCPATAGDVAYVMFTSGSTGRPKGVMISHDSLTEFVTALADLAGLTFESRCLALSSIGFDASVIDLLAPLATGATVALAGSDDRADPVRLQRFAASHQVSVAFLPPALLPILDPSGLPDLRVVLTGSEAPGPEQVRRWTADGRRFVNLYGPTEMTVLCTWFEASGDWDTPLPIGRPAANHRVYIVDEQLREVGADTPGELLAGGAGLALGYLGSPELTAQRFVADPYSGIDGARLYRTGDLAAWSAGGTLRFLGRLDRQVKVRGQRVELGEVEAVLRAHSGVDHAAVVALDDPSGARLVAYVTGSASSAAVREHCAVRLPAAMVPALVHHVGELPLLNSGKIDLDRLAALAREDQPAPDSIVVDSRREPASPVEAEVAAAWTQLLGRSGFGGGTDFFDAGGHSITAMRLVAALRERLRRDVCIEDVLEGRTVAGIADRAGAAAPLGEQPPRRGRPPQLSPAQRRLWFLERNFPASAAAYNITLAQRLRGPLDEVALGRALAAVAARQDVLSWRIGETGATPYAFAEPHPATPLPLPVTDLAGLAPQVRERELDRLLSAEIARRFDLAAEPLWRGRLVRLGPHEHVLAISAHHAVFDGWSQSLLYQDLAQAYSLALAGPQPPALPPLAATYGDYVAWREERARRRGEADLAWWVSHLDGAPVVLELPSDSPRPPELTFAGASVHTVLDRQRASAVAGLARDLGATASAVLLAAFAVVAGRLTGREDLVIGTPAVDRREADFQEMVGFFIEIAPLRLRPAPDATFAETVHRTRDELLAALAHPEAPLERIVSAFGLGGQVQRNPLVQVLFNMFNFAEPRLELPGLASEPVPVAPGGSAFDLTVYGVQRDGTLRLELVYNPDVYGGSTMHALLGALRETVVHAVAAPGVTVAELGRLVLPDVGAASPAEVPLARPRRVLPGTGSAAAASATERAVAAVWCDVLARGAVGVTDNFFDAGGDSLAITVVAQRLNQVLGTDLRVLDLFRFPTIRTLAAHLDAAGSGSDPGDGTDEAVALAAQRGAARRDRTRPRPRRGPEVGPGE